MSDGPIGPESTVEYTVKELLDKQTGLLVGIDQKLDDKASRAEVQAVDNRVKVLEDHSAEIKLAAKVRRRAWAVAGSLAVIATPVTVALVAAHHA